MSSSTDFIKSFSEFSTEKFTIFVKALEGAQNLFSDFESVLKTKDSLQYWRAAGDVKYTEDSSLYSKIVSVLSVDWSETDKSKRERAAAAKALVESLDLKSILETFPLEEINTLCDALETRNIDWIAGVEQLSRPAEELRQIAVVLAELERQTLQIVRTIQQHAYKVREDLITHVKEIQLLLGKVLSDTQRALETDLLKCQGDLKKFHQKRIRAVKIADQQLLESVQVIKQAKQTFEIEQLKLGLTRDAYVNYEPYQNLLKLAKGIQATHREVNLFFYPEQIIALLLKLLKKESWISSDIYKIIAFIQQLFPEDAKKLASLFDLLHDIPTDIIAFEVLEGELKQLHLELGEQEGGASAILLHAVEGLIEKRRALESSKEKPSELIAELKSYQADMQYRVITLLKLECREILKLKQMQNSILSAMQEIETAPSFIALVSLSKGVLSYDALSYSQLTNVLLLAERFRPQIADIELKKTLYASFSEQNSFFKKIAQEDDIKIETGLVTFRSVIHKSRDASDICTLLAAEKERRNQMAQISANEVEDIKSLSQILEQRRRRFEAFSEELEAEKNRFRQEIMECLQTQLSQSEVEVSEDSLVSATRSISDECQTVSKTLAQKLQEVISEGSEKVTACLEKSWPDAKFYWDGKDSESIYAILADLPERCSEDQALCNQLTESIADIENIVKSSIHEALLKHKELLTIETELDALSHSSTESSDAVHDSISELEKKLAKLKALSSEK